MNKNKEKATSKIKCDVTTCANNDNNSNLCKLKEVKISCCCCGDEVSEKDETICNSYKNIDNEK